MMQLQHKLEIKCETIKQATPKQYQTGSIWMDPEVTYGIPLCT